LDHSALAGSIYSTQANYWAQEQHFCNQHSASFSALISVNLISFTYLATGMKWKFRK